MRKVAPESDVALRGLVVSVEHFNQLKLALIPIWAWGFGVT